MARPRNRKEKQKKVVTQNIEPEIQTEQIQEVVDPVSKPIEEVAESVQDQSEDEEDAISISLDIEDEPEPPKKEIKVQAPFKPKIALENEEKKFFKFLRLMRTSADGRILHNDYSLLYSYLNDFNTVENKHNYLIANRHRRSLDLQNCKDVVKKKKEDLDIVEENIARAKLDEEAEQDLEVGRQIFEEPRRFDPEMTFESMKLSPKLMKALADMKISKPTPIQIGVIPEAFEGKDICGCASTGSGKTLAFLIPTVERLIHRTTKDRKTRILIITPSRELGIQIHNVGLELCKYTDVTFSLSVGGLSVVKQRRELEKNPDIVIATPGRLIAHIIGTKGFSLRDIEIIILDEADQMLSEGFTEQMKEILMRCCKFRQTLLFSATMSDTVKDLSAAALQRPVRIFVNKNTEVTTNLHQEFVMLKQGNDIIRLPTLVHLLLKVYKKKVIVFTQMKIQCTYVFILLSLLGVKCAELHSDKDQDARSLALERFKNDEVDILIATDVAARGIDIGGLNTVINLSLPDTYQQYVHRVGRTARCGLSGVAVSVVNQYSKPDLQILDSIRKFGTGSMTRRYLVEGYMNDVTNIINKLTPLVEDIHSRIIEARKKLDDLHAFKKVIGKAKTDDRKRKKPSDMTFTEAMREPEPKADRSQVKYEMKMKKRKANS